MLCSSAFWLLSELCDILCDPLTYLHLYMKNRETNTYQFKKILRNYYSIRNKISPAHLICPLEIKRCFQKAHGLAGTDCWKRPLEPSFLYELPYNLAHVNLKQNAFSKFILKFHITSHLSKVSC